MFHRFTGSWRRAFPAALVLICLSAVGPGSARADEYDDLREQTNKFVRAFDENRLEDALPLAKKLVERLEKYESTARDYIRAAYGWVSKQDSTASANALKAIGKALDSNPKAAEAYFLRGVLHYRKGDNHTAREDLRKALDLRAGYDAPVSERWYFNASKKLWEACLARPELGVAAEFGVAAQQFEELARQDPKHPQFPFYLGLAQMELGAFDQAAAAFLEFVPLRPNDHEVHPQCVFALKKSVGTKGAIKEYEALAARHAVPDIKVWLAVLYVADKQMDKAVPLLLQARHSPKLAMESRIELARALAEANRHQEAAEQFNRVLAEHSNLLSAPYRVKITLNCGTSLIRAGRLQDGINKLNYAMVLHRTLNPGAPESLDVLFELGAAHRQAAKQKNKRSEEAEIYFRKYLHELKEGTAGTQRFAKDVEAAEQLGDLYAEDGEHRKAAEVFQQALALIDVVVPADKEKCPTSRVRFKHVEALYRHGAWDRCIPAARDLGADKEYGLRARQMLAHAYVENQQPLKAIEQLNELRGTAVWNDDSLLFMGRALLAADRSADALKYLEEAFRKRPEDRERALEYAQGLRVVDRPGEARNLYHKILETSPRSARAWVGLGDLELQLAKAAADGERSDRLGKAVNYYKQARDLDRSAEVLGKLGQAERELAVHEADQQAHADRVRLVLYAGGLLLAALIPIGLAWFLYRRQWALRCFREVCALERDLTQLIRDRVQTRWGGDWARLGDDPFRGRLDYRALRNRAQKESARDVLAVANFGHLVGIIDAGWEALGFNELCAPEMVDPKEVIVANLSYVGSCRICLAHFGKLEELTGRHTAGVGSPKGHLSQHLHRQVRNSLKVIRAKFDLAPAPARLPVLTPVAPAAEPTRGPESRRPH